MSTNPFAIHRSNWMVMLAGPDDNAIGNNVWNMVYDHHLYELINRGRLRAKKDQFGRLELNGALHNMVDRHYFVSQSARIRVLLDDRKEVLSLRRLLRKLESERTLVTRGNLLATDTNYDQATQADRLEERQRFIDGITGTNRHARANSDVISGKLLEGLTKKAETHDDIVKHGHNYLFHVAPLGARTKLRPSWQAISYGQLKTAIKDLAQVTAFLYELLDAMGHSFATSPSADFFDYIDRPVIDAEAAEPEWEALAVGIANWSWWNWRPLV